MPFATDKDLKEYILRTLGKGILRVELTEDHLDDSLSAARRWFNANWGLIREILVDLQPEQNEILMPNFVVEVLNVFVEQVRLPPLIFDREFPFFFPFPLRAEGGIVFSYPSGLYSALVQQLTWIETLRRIFGAEVTFEYIPEMKKLRIFPAAFSERKALVQVISSEWSVAELAAFPEAEDLFVRWSIAEAKKRLGRIRSKHPSIPTAGGTQELDGSTLLDESREEMEKLNEEIRERGYPIPFITG